MADILLTAKLAEDRIDHADVSRNHPPISFTAYSHGMKFQFDTIYGSTNWDELATACENQGMNACKWQSPTHDISIMIIVDRDQVRITFDVSKGIYKVLTLPSSVCVNAFRDSARITREWLSGELNILAYNPFD